jgi:hypothetical protein
MQNWLLCKTHSVAYRTSSSPRRCPASPYCSSSQRYYAPDKERHPTYDASKCATQDQSIDNLVNHRGGHLRHNSLVVCRHNLVRHYMRSQYIGCCCCGRGYVGENYGAANADGATPMMLMRKRSRYCGFIRVLLLLLLSHACAKCDAVNATIQYGKRDASGSSSSTSTSSTRSQHSAEIPLVIDPCRLSPHRRSRSSQSHQACELSSSPSYGDPGSAGAIGSMGNHVDVV